ncbi:MAG: hypothetical protein Kow0074_22320 [Candidatus Zixiibacteriota bacterium]
MVLAFSSLLVSCGRSDSKTEWIEALGYTESDVIEVSFDQFGSPLVPVAVNDAYLSATFDTGNLVGLLVSTELANDLGLPVTGKRDLLSSSGDKVGEMHRYRVDSFHVFNQKWTNVTAGEYVGNAVQAMVGPQFLKNARVTIDYPNKILAVSQTPTPDTSIAGTWVPMFVSPRFPELILVEGTIDDSPTLFAINTGKGRSSIDPDWARLLELEPVRDGFYIENIHIAGYTLTVRSARGERFTGLEQGINRAIKASIGADILADLRITIDYKQKRVYFYKEPIETES